MLKRAAMIVGVVFVVVGVLGFVEAVAPPGADGEALLFGLFAVNATHNAVHLLSGIVALIVGVRSEDASAIYFRALGVIYSLVAVAGLFVGSGTLMGMAHNRADLVLHALVAVAALYLGFARGSSHPAQQPPRHAA